MCKTEISINREKRSLFTGEYIGKSVEKGHQGALIKITLKNVTNETGLIAAQICINETRDFRLLNLMPGDYIQFKATPEIVSCDCFDTHSDTCLSSSKSLRLLRPALSRERICRKS